MHIFVKKNIPPAAASISGTAPVEARIGCEHASINTTNAAPLHVSVCLFVSE